MVQFAGLVAAGQFQFNVVIPRLLGNGDCKLSRPSTAGATTRRAAMITVQQLS